MMEVGVPVQSAVYHCSTIRNSNSGEGLVSEKLGHRFVSGILALALPIIGLYAEYLLARYLKVDREITRIVVTVACVGLLTHSWLRQREYSRNFWELGFWTLALAVPLLGVVWLGLNVIRSHLYPLHWTDIEIRRWSQICWLQDWDEKAVLAVAVVAAVWGTSMLIAMILRHIPSRPRPLGKS